jgi:hypothetical protein
MESESAWLALSLLGGGGEGGNARFAGTREPETDWWLDSMAWAESHCRQR